MTQRTSHYAYPPPKGVPEHNEVLGPHQVEVVHCPDGALAIWSWHDDSNPSLSRRVDP
jgi:hypothetical protein